MAFGDSFLNCLGLKNELCRAEFRVSLFGQEGALISGVKKIAEIGEKKVSFLTAKKKLSVIGEGLKITSYGEKEVAVCGKITDISVEDAR